MAAKNTNTENTNTERKTLSATNKNTTPEAEVTEKPADVIMPEEKVEEKTQAQKSFEKASEGKRLTRETRKSFTKNDRLAFPQIPGFKTRVVNDINDGYRVKRMEDKGWVVVQKKDMPGADTRAGTPKQMAAPVRVSVGNGVMGVLMMIPAEWHEDDQKAKQDRITQDEKTELDKPTRDGSGYIDTQKVEVDN